MAAEDAAADATVLLRAQVAQSAHDLSNALGAVLNYAAFLAEDLKGSQEAALYLPHLESAARRAVDLVEQLQNYS